VPAAVLLLYASAVYAGRPASALVVLRWSVVLVGIGIGAAGWAARAQDGLTHPSRSFDAVAATVWTDGEPSLGGDRVEVSVDGHRWLMTVPFAMKGRSLGVGDRLVVSGSTVAFAKRNAYFDSRHLAGRFRLRRIIARHAPLAPFRVANGVRAAVLRSASGFSDEQRTLFAGFVLGDVTTARPELTDDFRASGLSHLVVVSGQNLAFLLAGLQPVLSRVGRRSLLIPAAIRLCVVIAFVFVARFEPSVLRAAVMAGVIIVTRAIGRPQPIIRVLAVAVGALLLLDPLLVRSVGFALSVGAVAGIALWSAWLTERLRSLGRLAGPVGITLAAQAGTAPVLLSAFDGVPVVSLPANLLALPLASPIMSWGVVAGIPAGLLGHGASAVIHVPTRLLLSAVAGVARGAARLPLGSLTSIDVLVGMALVGLLFVVRRNTIGHVAGGRRVIVVVLLLVMSLPSARVLSPWGPGRPSGPWVLAPAVQAYGGSGIAMARRLNVLVVAHGASPAVVLRRLRADRIAAVDAVVVISGGRPQKAMLRALRHRLDIGVVISPPSVGAPIGVAWKQARAGLVLTARSSIIRIESVKGNKVDIRVE
jgi:competence protein ComEC